MQEKTIRQLFYWKDFAKIISISCLMEIEIYWRISKTAEELIADGF